MKKTISLFHAILFISIIGCVCFFQSLKYPFLLNWDDGSYVSANPMIDFSWENIQYFFTHTKHSLFTPMTMLSLMIDDSISHAALIFRIHNLLLHIGSSVLLLLILKKCGLLTRPALWVVVFWMIHPQKIESVCWISERKDVLCGFYAFLSVFFFLQCKTHRFFLSFPLLSGICCSFAILSKPLAFTLPGFLLLLAFKFKIKLFHCLPAIIIGGLALIYASLMTAQDNPPVFIDDWKIPLFNILWYPGSLFTGDISPIYPHFQATFHKFAKYLLPDILFLACAVYTHIKLKDILLVLVMFFCIAIPVLGIHDSTFFTQCDRYNYLISAIIIASCGFMLQRLIAIGRKSKRKKSWFHTVQYILPSIFILLQTCIFFHYILVWKNETNLFQYAFHTSNDTPHFKTIEMLYADAMIKNNPKQLRMAASSLRKNASLYEEKLAKYLWIWEKQKGVSPLSITLAADFADVHASLLEQKFSLQKELTDIANRYESGVPLLCENFIIPALLIDLLHENEIQSFDAFLKKINCDALDPHILDYRKHLSP